MTLEWTPPAPPNGVVFTPSSDTDAQAARFFGEDIWFDVSAGAGANMIVTPAGDWLAVTGQLALQQSLLRRTITNPNEWKTKPNYGVGAREFVKAKDTAANRSELAARIRAQYLQDSRVESVDRVVIDKYIENIGPVLRINVLYTPRGRLRADQPQRILIELR